MNVKKQSSIVLAGVLFQTIVLIYINFFISKFNYINISIVFFILTPLIVLLFARNKSIFNPAIGYSLLFVAYYTIGSINFTQRGGYIPLSNMYYFMIGLLFFLIGTLLSDILFKRKGKLFSESNYSMRRLHSLGFILYIIGILSLVIAIFQTGSIPILSTDNVRRNNSSYLVATSYFSMIGFIMLNFVNAKNKFKFSKKTIIMGIIMFFLYFLSAYRTPLLLMLLVILGVWKNNTNKIKKKNILLLVILIIIICAIVPTIRDGNTYGSEHIKEQYIAEGFNPHFFWIAPIYNVLREGPNIFNQIILNINGNFLYGKGFLSNYITILPGDNINLRYLVTDLINSPTIVSKTPSIIGALYLDFGLVSISIGMLLLGFILQYLYKLTLSKRDMFTSTLYSFVFASSLLSIHSGSFFDPLTVFVIIIIILTKKMCTVEKADLNENI